MVTGFAEETQKLNKQEKELLPGMCAALNQRRGKENAITNKQMVKAYERLGVQISDARIRKMINYIRATQKVKNLIATSSGYYVATDKEEIENYKLSLLQRAEAIVAIAQSYE